MERVWKQEVWVEDISNKVDLFAERDRFASLEIQFEREKFLTDRTTKFLNTNYSQFSKSKSYTCAWTNAARRCAAMRLGIDLSGHSNLKISLKATS